MMHKLLALDPATHVTGYAFFLGGELHQYGVISSSLKGTWEDRCLRMVGGINLVVERQGVLDVVVAEFPQFQSGSRGQAASRGGDTLKLACLCGLILARYPTIAEFVTPSEWKGQCPKLITASRCLKRYDVGASSLNDMNYTDAIMIGDYWLKEQHRLKRSSASTIKQEDISV